MHTRAEIPIPRILITSTLKGIQLFAAVVLIGSLVYMEYLEMHWTWGALNAGYSWIVGSKHTKDKPKEAPRLPQINRKRAPNLLTDVYGINVNGLNITAVSTDWGKQLTRAWGIKCRVSCKDVAEEFGRHVSELYPKQPTKMTFQLYTALAGDTAKVVREALDWSALENSYQLTEKQTAFVKRLIKRIDGKELMAYALTELMPSSDGDQNRAILDFLLQRAGREFVELIPAVHDPYTSFGPFQPTQYAIYHVEELRGASITNQFLPSKLRIPGSVNQLRGNDHFKMATLFATDNLAAIARRIPDKDIPTGFVPTSELVSIISCSHHAPAPCRTAAVAWFKNGKKKPFHVEKIDPKGREVRRADDLNRYIQKSRANLAAL